MIMSNGQNIMSYFKFKPLPIPIAGGEGLCRVQL